MIDTLLLAILLVVDVLITFAIAFNEYRREAPLTAIEFLFHTMDAEDKIRKILKESDEKKRIEMWESELRIKDKIKKRYDEEIKRNT